MGRTITCVVGILVGLLVTFILFFMIAIYAYFNRDQSALMLDLQGLAAAAIGILAGVGTYKGLNWIFDI
jgi:ABC-type uncharacterized transport system permease subunit